jgi:tRNA U34 5-methylaminomethyl-2-thiouridine-forming methyltransferase MnmC
LAEDFELVALANGVVSLRSVVYGQTFHPVVGPVAEAEAVHLAGTRALARANDCQSEAGFTIWDVGLGAAANATALITRLLSGYVGRGDMHLLSFDRDLSALDFALAHAAELGYPAKHRALLETLRREGGVMVPLASSSWQLHWQVRVADFPSLLASPEPLPAPHAVFFDPYSPTVNRDMWTLELFASLHARLRDEVPCLLTTYTRSTAVRVTLLLAGFYVGLGHATGEKDQTTIAANNLGLLERPLDRAWLEKKVYASTNSAPLRAHPPLHTQAPISESDFAALRGHAQFRMQ